MDEKLVGSREEVAAYCVGFVALSVGCFSFLYGIIGMRDSMVERNWESDGQQDRRGYRGDNYRGEDSYRSEQGLRNDTHNHYR